MTISPIFKDTLFFAPTALTGANTNTSALQVAVQNQAACGVNFGPLISNEIKENGTYPYYVNGAPMGFLRANFLKETGGVELVCSGTGKPPISIGSKKEESGMFNKILELF